MTDDATPALPADVWADDAPEWYTREIDEAVLAGELPPAERHAWRIDSLGRAEWAMSKLRALTHRADEVAERAAEWADRIHQWERAEKARITPATAYFTTLLEQWGIEQRTANPKEATLRLPSGEVKTTMPKQPVVSIDDAEGAREALIEWLAEHCTTEVYEVLVKSEPAPQIMEIRKAVEVELEFVPFCQVCGAAIVFSPDHPPEHAKPPDLEDEPEFDVDAEYDHPPMPGGQYFAKLAGDVVPGLVVTLPDVTAKPKPAP